MFAEKQIFPAQSGIEDLDNFQSYLAATSEIKTPEDYLIRRYKHYLDHELNNDCKMLEVDLMIPIPDNVNVLQTRMSFRSFLQKYLNLLNDSSVRLLFRINTNSYTIKAIFSIKDLPRQAITEKVCSFWNMEFKEIFKKKLKFAGSLYMPMDYYSFDKNSIAQHSNNEMMITKTRHYIIDESMLNHFATVQKSDNCIQGKAKPITNKEN